MDALRTRSEIVNSLHSYVPGIVLILHGSLLNYMTIITKVGASYIDHMNDDVLKTTAFLTNVTRLSPPPFLRREPGDEARIGQPRMYYCNYCVP